MIDLEFVNALPRRERWPVFNVVRVVAGDHDRQRDSRECTVVESFPALKGWAKTMKALSVRDVCEGSYTAGRTYGPALHGGQEQV